MTPADRNYRNAGRLNSGLPDEVKPTGGQQVYVTKNRSDYRKEWKGTRDTKRQKKKKFAWDEFKAARPQGD